MKEMTLVAVLAISRVPEPEANFARALSLGTGPGAPSTVARVARTIVMFAVSVWGRLATFFITVMLIIAHIAPVAGPAQPRVAIYLSPIFFRSPFLHVPLPIHYLLVMP